MIFAYADPPYVGQAKRHYGCKEIDQQALIDQLVREYPDGWALSCSSSSLQKILRWAPVGVRVGAWVKPFAFYKPGIDPAYTWEPIVWAGGRPDAGKRRRAAKLPGARDSLVCNPWGVTAKERAICRVHGRKPVAFSRWVFALLGAMPEDTLVDMFLGSGAVTEEWNRYITEPL